MRKSFLFFICSLFILFSFTSCDFSNIPPSVDDATLIKMGFSDKTWSNEAVYPCSKTEGSDTFYSKDYIYLIDENTLVQHIKVGINKEMSQIIYSANIYYTFDIVSRLGPASIKLILKPFSITEEETFGPPLKVEKLTDLKYPLSNILTENVFNFTKRNSKPVLLLTGKNITDRDTYNVLEKK